MHISFNRTSVISALIVWLWFSFSLAAETFRLPQLASPNSINADAKQAYITDGNTVYIYSLKDFKLKTKFGKTGEGPGEFIGSPGTGRAPLRLDVMEDKLLVNSFGKVSLFTKDGRFIEEIKLTDRSRWFIGFEKGFAANMNQPIENVRYRTVNIHDGKLKKTRLLMKRKHSLQGQGGGYNPFEGPMSYDAYKDRLYVCWELDFIIRVFDPSGNEVKAITHPYEKREITSEDKKKIDNHLKNDPRFKSIYPFVKPFSYFKHFPVLSRVIANDGKIYAICRQDVNKRTECYIFSLEGKLVKKMFIDLKYVDVQIVYPYNIQSGKLYQLIEDEEEEEWTVHVNELK
ncbi:MAG: hypothetical protein GY940_42080 [bacterium]|nr:hypothetical protein [bacterium]